MGEFNSEDYTFLRHEPCTKCKSSDGVGVYLHKKTGGETKYCFACASALVTTSSLYRAKQPGSALDEESLSRLNWTSDIAQKYRVTKEGLCVYYGFARADGKLVGVFKRDYNKAKDDEYHFVWHLKPDPMPLYGMDTCVGTENLILVTGLNDAISAHIMTGMNAVSLPSGDSGVQRAIEDNFQWIRQFKRVYLVFDNDVSGQAAAAKAQTLLGFRAVNVVLPDLVINLGDTVKSIKDSTDFLRYSLRREFTTALETALTNTVPYEYGEEADDEYASYILNRDKNLGLSTGIEELDERCRLRPHEITVLFGAPGRGKSTFTRHLVAAVASQRVKPYYLSLEDPVPLVIDNLRQCILREPVADTKAGLLQQSKRIRDIVSIARLDRPSVQAFEDACECAIVSKNCTVIFLDHITVLVNLAKDPRAEAVSYMNVIVDLAKRYPVHFFIVSHNKPPELVQAQKGKKFQADWEEKQEPTMRDAQWSSAFEQLAWNIWGWKNPDDTLEPARLYILKNRKGGMKSLGRVYLYFDEESKTYMDSKEYAKRKTVPRSRGDRWDKNPIHRSPGEDDNRDVLSSDSAEPETLCVIPTLQDSNKYSDRTAGVVSEEGEDESGNESTDDRGGKSISNPVFPTHMEPRLRDSRRLAFGVQRANDERVSFVGGNLQVTASHVLQAIENSLHETGLHSSWQEEIHLPDVGRVDRSTLDVLRPDTEESGESGEDTGTLADQGSTPTQSIWGRLKS